MQFFNKKALNVKRITATNMAPTTASAAAYGSKNNILQKTLVVQPTLDSILGIQHTNMGKNRAQRNKIKTTTYQQDSDQQQQQSMKFMDSGLSRIDLLDELGEPPVNAKKEDASMIGNSIASIKKVAKSNKNRQKSRDHDPLVSSMMQASQRVPAKTK